MFAALYGDLELHPWRDPDSQHDAHSLFRERSLAMGWLDDRAASGGSETSLARAPGLWALNDAGWEDPLGHTDSGLVSWFQVEASAAADDRALPVWPFLRCAGDVMSRVGTLRLTALQVLVPAQGVDPTRRPAYARVPSIATARWFAEPDSASSCAVQVDIYGGRATELGSIATAFGEVLTQLDQAVLKVQAIDAVGEHYAPRAAVHDSAWNGPPTSGVRLRGTAVEWSIDVAGWLTEIATDCMSQVGVQSPLLVTLARA